MRKADLFHPRNACRLNPSMLLHSLALWPVMARPEQLPPNDDWNLWLLLGGRGAGKTRAGAEWIRDQAWQNGKRHIALVAQNYQAAREVMIECVSGLQNIGYVDSARNSLPHAACSNGPTARSGMCSPLKARTVCAGRNLIALGRTNIARGNIPKRPCPIFGSPCASSPPHAENAPAPNPSTCCMSKAA